MDMDISIEDEDKQFYPQLWKDVKFWPWQEDHHFNYNEFFYPNICHVCKKAGVDDLIPCNQCHMIFYCSKLHQDTHRYQHQNFCKIWTHYLRVQITKSSPNIEETELKFHKRLTSWNQIISKNSIYEYNLLTYEKEMILFTNACLYSDELKQYNTFPCQQCYSVNFCNDHKGIEYLRNHPFCKQHILCLNLNVLNLIYRFTIPTTFPDKRSYFNMENYVENYVANYKRKWAYFEFNEILHSDYASDPLTVYNTLNNANLLKYINKEICCLHIILATILEKNHIPAWELLLHICDQLKHLIIILVGSELGENSETELACDTLCDRCVQFGKTLSYKYITTKCGSYTSFVINLTKKNIYWKPDIIIGFQVHLGSFVTNWISIMDVQRIPYFLTAGLEEVAITNIERCQNIFKINILYDTPNIFKSLRPCRMCHVNSIGYRNEHVTILENTGDNIDEKQIDVSPPKRIRTRNTIDIQQPDLMIEPQPSTSWAT